jgi:hypothetical protein
MIALDTAYIYFKIDTKNYNLLWTKWWLVRHILHGDNNLGCCYLSASFLPERKPN